MSVSDDTTQTFVVYPAIDVRDGRVVRLRQGDYSQETRYAEDPFALAMRYADAGARWLHLVDLDAARTGGYTLAPLLQRIADDGRLRVQTGGGVRDENAVRAMLDAGASRVVVGSLSVRAPELVESWVSKYKDRIVVALDTRQDDDGVWRLPIHGWTERAELDLPTCLRRYREVGARHVLCTDIARDGMLQGPNLALYRMLIEERSNDDTKAGVVGIQASGGVRDLADVVAAKAAGCAGVVLGKALLEGRLELAEALAC
jgi:phosphoribosylformimino-5-aminoimidazole carboxamide ribotide isomerase